MVRTQPASWRRGGLQSSGKTTTTAKMAKRRKEKERKKALRASLAVNRPAAQEQLATLGTQTDVATLPTVQGQQPDEIARRALQAANLQGYDELMPSTAGRVHSAQALIDASQAASAAQSRPVIRRKSARGTQSAIAWKRV